MAKKSLINKANAKPKYKVRGYTRCRRCGRARSVYRKFGLCRVCLREHGPRRRDPRHDQGELVRRRIMMTDPIADMLTRSPQRQHGDARRSAHARRPSRRSHWPTILQKEGYISGFSAAPSTTGPGDVLDDLDEVLRRSSPHHLRPASHLHPRPAGLPQERPPFRACSVAWVWLSCPPVRGS